MKILIAADMGGVTGVSAPAIITMIIIMLIIFAVSEGGRPDERRSESMSTREYR
jgi:hypothetical protein